MADEKSGPDEQAVEQLMDEIKGALAEGTEPVEIARELAAKLEWSENEVLEFVETVQSRMVEEYLASPHGEAAMRETKRAQGARRMLFGTLWMVGGAIVSLITYQLASGGGTYFVFWGAIIWGGIDFIRGLADWMSNQDGPSPQTFLEPYQRGDGSALPSVDVLARRDGDPRPEMERSHGEPHSEINPLPRVDVRARRDKHAQPGIEHSHMHDGIKVIRPDGALSYAYWPKRTLPSGRALGLDTSSDYVWVYSEPLERLTYLGQPGGEVISLWDLKPAD